MDVRFDADAAERLLGQMENFCFDIQNDFRELDIILDEPGEWQDKQMQAFQKNVEVLKDDLNDIFDREWEYMKTYKQRVKELKG